MAGCCAVPPVAAMPPGGPPPLTDDTPATALKRPNGAGAPSPPKRQKSPDDVTEPFFADASPLRRPRAASDLTSQATLMAMPLSVVIFGATGDLARKKLFPALFKLCAEGHLPRDLNVVGYGRSAVEIDQFVAKQCVNVAADADAADAAAGADARWSRAAFVERISFHAGGYDAPPSYASLDAKLRAYEGAHASGLPGNRIFFLSVPPTVFGAVAEMISRAARAPRGGFTRLMIEKPFGRDSASFDALDKLTSRHFDENQLFRVDHYLGKEILLNIPTLRWANAMFEPLWSNAHVESVQIIFKENIGTDGRGGYFDGFGIIRDIIQNHLLQAFMFVACEPPADMSASATTRAKVELLRAVRALDLGADDTFLGQFGPSADGAQKGYLDDATVPEGSRCPTFAACVLAVDNARWRGVPFLLSAGKGLDERLCEIRVRFKPQPFQARLLGTVGHNELVMRVQPDEAVYMVAHTKTPGLCAGREEEARSPVALGMRYATAFGDGSPFIAGDAYERMLLNAARGDQTLSVSAAELVEAWRIFTPLLAQIDATRPAPVRHAFGELPAGYAAWAQRHGIDVARLGAAWDAKQAAAHLRADVAEAAEKKAAAAALPRVQAKEEDLAFGY